MKKVFSALLALVFMCGCLHPISVGADQTDPQVLHSRYRNEPGTYVGTVRYEYNRAGVLIREIWEEENKEVFYDYSSNGILKNIYVDVNGENVEMKKFRSDGTGWILWEANSQRELAITREYTVTLDSCGRPASAELRRIYDDEIWGETSVYTYHHSSEPKIGDTVTFGTYEQDNVPENGQEPIEWQVLDQKNGNLLLISVHALDSQRYHKENTNITWEDCTLRSWLNGYFYSMAFTPNQQAQIQETTTGTGGVRDNLFLLSLDEVNKYLPQQSQRCSQATPYAIAQNAFVDPSGRSWWLLRTSAASGSYVMSTNCDGSLDLDGGRVASDRGTVRPALWIRAEAVTGQDAPVQTCTYTDYYVTGETRTEHCHKVYEYDKDGRLLSEAQSLNDMSEVDNLTAYTYDAQGNLTKVSMRISDNFSYSLSRTTTYLNTYDDQKQLIRVETGFTEISRSTGKSAERKEMEVSSVVTYEYDSKGNRIREESTFADGTVDYVKTWSYDTQGNLLKVTLDGKITEENTYGPLSKALWN